MKPKNSLPMHREARVLRNAMVLLSGGLDSTALLHLARETYDDVAAVGVAYGQVNRDAELSAAGNLCQRHGVSFSRLDTADAVRGLGLLIPPLPGLAKPGVSRANLPVRNVILISIAAAEACRRWPGARIDVLVGATLDDAAGFPDCRRETVEALSRAMSYAAAGVANVAVLAPWAKKRKHEVLSWVASRPEALADVRESVSCYRGVRCGECDACTLRASAFATCGLTDGEAAAPAMFGGDPAREARLK